MPGRLTVKSADALIGEGDGLLDPPRDEASRARITSRPIIRRPVPDDRIEPGRPRGRSRSKTAGQTWFLVLSSRTARTKSDPAAPHRTQWQDQTLHAELPGYQEYTARVRYKLIPGVW
jgi:hypothetical protein